MNEHTGNYIIEGGQMGANRLHTLARATWPYAKSFFKQAGLQSGMRILDIGCGNGAISMHLLTDFEEGIDLTGMDFDPEMVERARQSCAMTGLKARFEVLNLELEELETEAYNFIYCRFLLSHLAKPEEALKKILRALKPQGILAVEDVDFAGHFCYPHSHAFYRYVELYTQTATAKGHNPLIGPQLPELLDSAGFEQVDMQVVLPTFRSGAGKQMALLTAQAIQNTVVHEGMSHEQEMNKLIQELERFTAAPDSLMSLPRIFQVSGRKK